MSYNLFILMAASLLLLSGCAPSAQESATSPPEASASPNEPADHPNKAPEPAESAKPVRFEDLPSDKELQVTIEGSTEMVKANLMRSELGYALYVTEGFEFTPEEPNQDLVFHRSFPDYFLRIQPMGTDADVDQLRKMSKNTLRSISSQIVDLKPSFPDRTIASQAEFILQASNEQVTLEAIAMPIGGRLFRFTLHLPIQEASEGIIPRFYAMIRSIVPLQ